MDDSAAAGHAGSTLGYRAIGPYPERRVIDAAD
jgi:hypothetical protein